MPDPVPASFDCRVAIIGGGAAGLMAAIVAARAWRDAGPGAEKTAGPAGRPVIILEKQERVGRKLLATGNGQCNLSNSDPSPEHFHGCDPEFAKPVLRQLTSADTLGLFRSIGLPCRTEEGGRIYPFSYQAAAVLDVLRQAAARLGVQIETSFAVSGLLPLNGKSGHADAGFCLTAADGRKIRASQVILATGGMAAPALGCDGSGYELMTRLGHRMTDIFPALVQVRTETDLVRGLAGLKFTGTVTLLAGKQTLQEASGEILFTEYGLSGPPLLALSRQAAASLRRQNGEPVWIILDLLPELKVEDLLEWLHFRRNCDPDLELAEFLTGLIHKKIGQAMLKRCLDRSLAHPANSLTDAELSQLARLLKALPIRVTGTRDWSQAQVTAGGLDVRDFFPDTLESRLVPGLYAAGEILDIDGDCGGFNLQWAWSSGFVAGTRAMQASLAGTGSARFRAPESGQP